MNMIDSDAMRTLVTLNNLIININAVDKKKSCASGILVDHLFKCLRRGNHTVLGHPIE